ncbi:SWIB/MDM2 domain-containing protein [Scheffersomyces amazonensis]|uniref:SWIB/MDM2 domain-containing protein n=1 Tax=Scheffersomyces amazonensis TaxID=1078765 RepID=UPI00315C910A
MSDPFNADRYLPTIDAILSVADLEQITVKRIRNALQELFGVNLLPHKKEINEVILTQYYDLISKREESEKSEKERRDEIERQDAIMAARLSRSEISGPIVRSRKTRDRPVKEVKKRKVSSDRENVFMREMILSPDLEAIVGAPKLPRPHVVKQLWAYIKSHDMQDPKDKRFIICDDKFQKLFKKKSVGAFEMNKLLSKHLIKPDEVDGVAWTMTPAPVKSEPGSVDSVIHSDPSESSEE